ncbi:uncharacterized protein LOC103511668 [Diaphorina citri]|uniref:Uncharacterized protein LOC103511668 n=1 Tax=Diaphorina citri TaxID=121845 RepID=A0A1S4EEP0_DIACI|nr:uncharacterized protein LOC103511668 [Diaphorina citri]
MKGAWTHIVQHVRPKQEVQQINRLIANYEYQKSNPGHGPIEVSLHKPEDVILHKKREKLKQILEQKRKEEALLDEEIKLAQKQLEEKRNTELKKDIFGLQHRVIQFKYYLTISRFR